MTRKSLFGLAALATLLAFAAVAFGASVKCTSGVTCNGTSGNDTIRGTRSAGTINGLAAKIGIKARP